MTLFISNWISIGDLHVEASPRDGENKTASLMFKDGASLTIHIMDASPGAFERFERIAAIFNERVDAVASKQIDPDFDEVDDGLGDIDLKQFCMDDESYRGELQTPFSIGEWTYATNGHICVRVPRRADVAEKPEAPNASVLFNGIAKPHATIPHFSKPEGVGGCPVCDGEGGGIHDCPSCSCECGTCRGSGEAAFSVGLFGVPFSAVYVALLQKLPNLLIAASKPVTPGEGLTPQDSLPFCFDGGEGVLMPLRSPDRHHVDVVPK